MGLVSWEEDEEEVPWGSSSRLSLKQLKKKKKKK